MRFADCRKLKIFHSPLKDLNALHNPPAAGNSRTRRPGAGLSAQAALSPAMQPVVRRPPAKRFALPLFSPSLTRPRGCTGQVAHRVCACAQPRTHAVPSGRGPALSFCFPKQGESPAHVPCAREETRRAKAPAHPPRTETLEKAELCSLPFQAFPLSAGGLRPNGRLSRPAARKRGRSAKGCRRPPLHRNARKS